jgi:hypothetical protein
MFFFTIQQSAPFLNFSRIIKINGLVSQVIVILHFVVSMFSKLFHPGAAGKGENTRF